MGGGVRDGQWPEAPKSGQDEYMTLEIFQSVEDNRFVYAARRAGSNIWTSDPIDTMQEKSAIDDFVEALVASTGDKVPRVSFPKKRTLNEITREYAIVARELHEDEELYILRTAGKYADNK